MPSRICVVGAGIVGITSALELRQRGHDVVLFDRGAPAKETSFGNAGVLSASSITPSNNPNVLRALPSLVFKRLPYFDYQPVFVLSHLGRMAQFLRYSMAKHTVRIATALRQLQVLSLRKHRLLIQEANAGHLLRDSGWLRAYRSERRFVADRMERDLMKKIGVDFEILSRSELVDTEPNLKPVYEKGIIMREGCSVADPFELASAYFKLFCSLGGQFIEDEVLGVSRQNHGKWSVNTGSTAVVTDHIVLATGPWAPDLCGELGYNIPMLWERGYHAHIEAPALTLSRPVHDVENGFVMSSINGAVRITSGVELANRDAPPNFAQIHLATRAAQSALGFKHILDATPWMGCRPSLPDGLPIIGQAPHDRRLWFNFGHQHIGVSASAGSAEVLADLIEERQPVIDVDCYSPVRFRL